MDKQKRINQMLIAVMLIPLLLLSGCGMASELFIEEMPTETPIPSPTATVAPTITPTITPTPGLPSNIATMFGEEVPELIKNEQGIYTAEDAFWKAIYENGEWRVRPRPHTGFDEQFLEAVGEKYLGRDDTPDTLAQVAADLLKDRNYDSRVGFTQEQNVNIAKKIVIYGRIIGFEWVSFEEQPGGQIGDRALVTVVVNSNYPDEKIPLLMGIEKNGRFIRTAKFLRWNNYNKEDKSLERMEVQEKADFDKYIGELVKLSIPYYFKPGWSKDLYFDYMAKEDYNLIHNLLISPDGYMMKYTNIKNSPDHQSEHRKMVEVFPEIMDSMNLDEGGDLAFFGYAVTMFK